MEDTLCLAKPSVQPVSRWRQCCSSGDGDRYFFDYKVLFPSIATFEAPSLPPFHRTVYTAHTWIVLPEPLTYRRVDLIPPFRQPPLEAA
jgi:hypothetical protein